MGRSFAIFFALLLTAGLAALLFYPSADEEQNGERAALDSPKPVEREVAVPPPLPEKGATGLLTLDWEELIPPDWEPDLIFQDYDIDQLDDDDLLALQLLDKLQEVWAAAPVVAELDGRLVRLPGFAVPLDAEPGRVAEFILVPYFGACIHVPPPPANQIVYIKARKPDELFQLELFDTVWVQGTMQTESFSSELGRAGYSIIADSVEPYRDDALIRLE